MTTDTIFALSTGSLPSGVAIVRCSGPSVRTVFETLIDSTPKPRRACLADIRDSSGGPIDRGLILFFPAPASFTGEDVIELHLHGGRAVVAATLRALSERDGFRPAEPGEFTRRAFVNGRLDLTQVEGLADLIAAETEAQRRQALRQAGGGLRDLYDGWRVRLVRTRALLEAELDFPDEEDVPGSVSDAAWSDVADLAREIARHLDDGRRGERLRSGFEIVVLGAPNAGKSSLINALARRDVAIVSPEPGTTRDMIEVHLDLEDYPVTVVDTAGLRDAAGGVEAEGIRRAAARAAAADLVVWLRDVTQPSEAAPPEGFDAPVMRVGTKVDLIDLAAERARLAEDFECLISTREDDSLDDLVGRLAAAARSAVAGGDGLLVTRARQRSAIADCLDALTEAVDETGRALELRAEDLRRATEALGRVTGRVDVEDMLDVIFGEFCIGK